jgi:hypothetical protein
MLGWRVIAAVSARSLHLLPALRGQASILNRLRSCRVPGPGCFAQQPEDLGVESPGDLGWSNESSM